MPNLLDVQLASFKVVSRHGQLGRHGGVRDWMRSSGSSSRWKDTRGPTPSSTRASGWGSRSTHIQECRERNLTFEAPLKATLRLVRWEPKGKATRKFIEAEEAEIYLGDIPLITERGTFIVNGAERVIVSQLHRSPGVFFQDKIHPNGTTLYFAKIIPYRGTWVEVRMGIKDEMFIRTDRRHQFRMTTFLRALGYSKDEDIRRLFYETEDVELPSGKADARRPSRAAGSSPQSDHRQGDRRGRRASAARSIAPKHVKLSRTLGAQHGPRARDARRPASSPARTRRGTRSSSGASWPGPTSTPDTKEIVVKNDEKLTPDGHPAPEEGRHPRDRTRADRSRRTSRSSSDALARQDALRGRGPSGDLQDDEGRQSPEHRGRARARGPDVLRPQPLRPQGRRPLQDQPSSSASTNEEVPLDTICLTHRDFIATIRAVLDVVKGKREIDDIDHLGNRRVRSVGELLENQLSAGLSRMVRVIKDRMSTGDADDFDLATLVNSRPISAVVRAFFGSNQLSQFMEQTNPLAELTHKRRLSALGPGRSHERERGLRGPGRPLQPLRTDVPDRDAGRSEHRSHQFALDVRPDQRLRLHRDAVLQRRRRASSPSRDRVPDGVRGGQATSSPRPVSRRHRRQAHRRSRFWRDTRTTSRRCRARRSSSWTSRRSSSSPRPPRSSRSSSTTTRTGR